VASVLPPRRETLALVSGASAGAVTWFVLLIGTGRAGEWLRHPVDMFDQAAQVVNTAATPFDPAGPVGDLLLLMGLMLGIAASSLLVGVGAPFATGGFLSLLLLAPVAATGVVVDRSLIIAAGVLLVLLAWTRRAPDLGARPDDGGTGRRHRCRCRLRDAGRHPTASGTRRW
jgi:hypothetical protein